MKRLDPAFASARILLWVAAPCFVQTMPGCKRETPTARAARADATPAPSFPAPRYRIAPAETGSAAALLASVEAFNRRDWESAAVLLAPDYEFIVWNGSQTSVRGREAVVSQMKDILRSFPDFRVQVRRIIEGQGVCVMETISRGTSAEEGSNGRPVVGEAIEVHEFERGALRRTYLVRDSSWTFRQLRKSAPPEALLRPAPLTPVLVSGPSLPGIVDTAKSFYSTETRERFWATRAEGLTVRSVLLRRETRGRQAAWSSFYKNPPSDLTETVEQIVAAGNAVVVRSRATFRYDGPEASMRGEKLHIHAVTVYRFEKGRVAEVDSYSDPTELAGQYRPQRPADLSWLARLPAGWRRYKPQVVRLPCAGQRARVALSTILTDATPESRRESSA